MSGQGREHRSEERARSGAPRGSEPGGSTSLVEVSGLTVEYRRTGQRVGTPAVRGVDLTIGRGEKVALVGESGSGKTTTALALMGLLPGAADVTAGSIRIDGHEVAGQPERRLRRLRGRVVGLVPQDPMVSLDPTMRIGRQVGEAVRRRGDVDGRQVSAEVVAALEEAGLDDGVLRARQYPHELSGGMRQRVLIALALAARPALLIADEPTSALDVTTQRRILDHLDTLVSGSGTSLLIITHDLGVAADRADRVVVMRDGVVVEQGEPRRVLVSPEDPYTRQLVAASSSLGGARTLPRTAGPAEQVAQPILELSGISKRFALPSSAAGAASSVLAVDDVSLSVPAGQTVGLVGESGSGKTTTLRIALGLETPTSGTVRFAGEVVSGRSWRSLRELRRRFQLVHQDPFASLDPRFTLEQTITEPLVSFRVGTRAERRARAAVLMEQVALPATLLGRRPAELSGGQRQRVAIARALALSPDLLLLDEPVSALDVSVRAQVLDLLAELQRELGLSYLLVSHDLAVVEHLAQEVVVLRRGRVVETGGAAAVLADPQHEYTRELVAAVPGRRHAAAWAERG